jgi:excisionase family DNA binding protein
MHREQFPKSHLSIAELASRWGCHPLTIRRRLKRGEIKCLRISSQLVRIELAEVERIEKEARC